MNQPKVSVVIPAHNAEPFISKAIKSCLDQTYLPHEIIVASDGSTDGTVEVAKSFGVTVLDLPKGNGNIARNAAVKVSGGDIIAFLDADDWFLPSKLDAHVRAHEASDWSFIIDPATMIDTEGNHLRLCGPALGGPLAYEKFTLRTFWYGGSSFSVQRQKLEAISGWREELFRQQDIDLWLRLAHQHGPAFVMKETHTMYLQSPGSVSRTPKNVKQSIATLTSGLPFLTTWQRRRLSSHIVFTAVDNLDLKAALPLLAWTLDRIGDPRWTKAFMRSAQNQVRRHRK